MTENTVKEFLFDHINKFEEKYKKLIAQNKFSVVIEDIISNCYDKAIQIDKKEESLTILSTGILHYLLTNSSIPSQRKVKLNGIELDIVIPDVKTLQNDPKKTLVLNIPKTSNKKTIEKQIKKLEEIQPEKNNIWLVLIKNTSFKNKSFVVSSKNSNFSQIIYEIAQFVNINCQNKLKILRI